MPQHKALQANPVDIRNMSDSLIDKCEKELEACDEGLERLRQEFEVHFKMYMTSTRIAYEQRSEIMTRRSALYAMRGMVPGEFKTEDIDEAGDALQDGMDKDTKPEAAE